VREWPSGLVLPRVRTPQRQLTWAPLTRGIERLCPRPGRVPNTPGQGYEPTRTRGRYRRRRRQRRRVTVVAFVVVVVVVIVVVVVVVVVFIVSLNSDGQGERTADMESINTYLWAGRWKHHRPGHNPSSLVAVVASGRILSSSVIVVGLRDRARGRIAAHKKLSRPAAPRPIT
jgi:ABC-type Fe3+ transport system permease subunit